MISLIDSRFNRKLCSVLIFVGVLVFVISLTGSFGSVLAADDPAPAGGKSSQSSLDIPGSFKDLPDTANEVTAKRSPEQIAVVTPADSTLPRLDVDAEKAARPDFLSLEDIDSLSSADLVDFHATAYCLKGRTASGINARPGIIAADPSVLPLGTVVHLRAGRYTGTYTVMDTGGRIKGRRVDVYVESQREAVEFGRRQVKVKVLKSAKRDRANKNVLADM
jgi:3D (Asp-Asp-Asp) domain-containing protein